MDKIKRVVSENGTIIPIHNISLIAGEKSSHYVWTNADGYDSSSQDSTYYISNQYKRLIEYIREDAFIEKACDAYCAICDTKECQGCAECSWVIKFRRQLLKY